MIARDQPPDQLRFAGVVLGAAPRAVRRASRIAHRNHEDAIDGGVEPGRLEIELQAVQLVERQVAKVGAAGRDEVLLLGRQHERAILAEFAECAQAAAVFGVHQVAQLAGTFELRDSVKCPAGAPSGSSESSSTHGLKRTSSRTSRPVSGSRRQTIARPSHSAHTDTIPGVGSQPPSNMKR